MAGMSEERREQVLAAALKEFAAHGYHGTSTGAIAKRAGISQPYIYALFPNKQELFLATSRLAMGRLRDRFTAAARGATDSDDALTRMAEAYMELLADRDEIMFQLQTHAAAQDPQLREQVRDEFQDIMRHVATLSGAPQEDVVKFIAHGMLLNVLAALDLPLETEKA
jgi:AcrR family transcriptional regulator